MVSPICLVNSQNTTNGVDVNGGDVVVIQLQDLTGVNSWTCICTSTDELQDTTVINASVVIDNVLRTATFTMPTESTGVALIFESTVNQGLNNGVRDSSLKTKIKICSLAAATNSRVVASDETIEGNAEFGWITVVNTPIRYGGGGGGGSPTGPAGGDLAGTYPNPTIGTNKVTFAKFQQISTDKILGRDTAGTGNIEQLSVSGGLEFTGSTGIQRSAISGDVTINAGATTATVTDFTIASEQQGSTLYFNGSNWVQLAPGTDGYVLTTHSTSANPTWEAAAGGGVPSGPAGGDLTGTYPNPTIGTNKTTFAKFQQIATDSLLGRDTAGTGNVENILLNTTLSMDGAGNLQRAALTGDVTASAGSNTTAIASNAVTTAKIADANVTLAKLANITTDSLIGRDTAGTGVPEVITLGASLSMSGAQVLQRAALTGDVTASVNSNATTIANNAVTFAKMATQAALSVVANATNATAVPSAVAASTDGYVFARSGTTLSFIPVSTANITDNSITLAKMQTITTDSLLGRDTTGTGNVEIITLNSTLEMTGTQVLQRAALTGDVTATAGSNTTAIASNVIVDADINSAAAISFSKLANITTDSLLGRDTAGTGALETITLGASLSMSGTQVLQRAALTGDVTASVNSNTTAIAANVIVDADINSAAAIAVSKLANATAKSVLGRSANSAGAYADIAATTTGQPLVFNGTTVAFGNPDFGALNVTSTGALTIAGITNSGAYAGGTNPASAGIVRLPNATNIRFRNAANSADVDGLAVDASNNVILGNSSDTSITLNDSTDTINLRTAGVVQLAIDANSADFQDNYIVTSATLRVGTSPASSGTIRLPNNSSINFASSGGTAVTGLAMSAADRISIGSSSSSIAGLDLGVGSSGNFGFGIGGTSVFSISSSIAEILVPTFRFDVAVVSPVINQEDDSTNSITADTLTINAQNAIGTTSTGGKLLLASGTGTSRDGYVEIDRGSTKIFESTNLGTDIGDGYVMFEAAQLGTRRVTALNYLTGNITTTQLPTNSGDGVTYVANAVTEPTANATGGNTIWSTSATAAASLKAKNTLNTSWALMPGAAWNKHFLSGNGTTTSTSSTTVATLNFSQFGNGSGSVVYQVMSRDATNSQGCSVYGFSFSVQGGSLSSGTTTPTALYGSNALVSSVALAYPGSGNIDFKVTAADANTNNFYILAEITYHLNS